MYLLKKRKITPCVNSIKRDTVAAEWGWVVVVVVGGVTGHVVMCSVEGKELDSVCSAADTAQPCANVYNYKMTTHSNYCFVTYANCLFCL